MLITILQGALWPKVRRETIYNNQEDVACPLCNYGGHTEHHMFWTCPHLTQATHPAITKTNVLIKEVKAALGQNSLPKYECFWLRGIPPRAWVTTPILPSFQITHLGGGQILTMAKPIIYTDGSGGRNTDDPRTRRCGWAWV